MRELMDNPGYGTLWNRVMAGFRHISGRDWEERADYPHFWALAQHLYQMAYGPKAVLPDELKGPLGFMYAGHAGRVRKGLRERPYFHHILMVVYMTWLLRMPLYIQRAAICHDDREDVPGNLGVSVAWVDAMLETLIGADALETVKNLTNAEHPDGKHAGQLAKMADIPRGDATLKLLDRIANLYDLRRDRPKGFGPKRLAEECRKAQELAQAMPLAAPEAVLALLAFSIDKLESENNLTAGV